jgi:hypothetical protein
MGCHTLGKKAYRVTKKFELVTITSPLFDMDFLKVDFRVAGFSVTGMGLRQIGADMDMNKIETYVDADQQPQGVTDTCGDPAGTGHPRRRSCVAAPEQGAVRRPSRGGRGLLGTGALFRA